MRRHQRVEIFSKPIYTFDLETDPFLHGRKPQPFAAGLYDGRLFRMTWGAECISEMINLLGELPSGIIYAHNGGKFDFYYLLPWMVGTEKMLIIQSRIVVGTIRCPNGREHQIRDSFAIMPFALAKYDKDEIDYAKMEKENREENRDEIVSYLKKDCTALYKLCTSFVQMFGDKTTVGRAAMDELCKLHKYEILESEEDRLIRRRFYYGGRVQCFERGILKPQHGKRFKIYDINQSYPNAMRNFLHPIGHLSSITREIGPDTFFVVVSGKNHGAFPTRTREGLTFTAPAGIFQVTIHELLAGIETGLFELDEIYECYNFALASTFDKFVDRFHGLRREAKLKKDKIKSLLYKTVSNSAYGKFAQSPENYYDFRLLPDTEVPPGVNFDKDADLHGWEPCEIEEFAGMILWRRRSENIRYYNVATGASITGAARAVLMRAIARARRPLYCDTDSLICEGLDVEVDDTKLGAWKLEAEASWAAIAGRKTYAMFRGQTCVKSASKGAILTPDEIVRVCRGEKIEWKSDAPSFSIRRRDVKFVHRVVQMTA